MSEAKRDQNRVPTLLAVSNVDSITPVVLWADPFTHRLLVDLPGGAGDVVGPASAVDSNFAAFDTTTGKLIKDSGYNASSFLTSLSGAFLLDQTTPQTVVNGAPIFNAGLKSKAIGIFNLNTVDGPAHLAGTALAIVGADNNPVRFGISSFGIAGTNAYAARHARNTAATPQAVQSGDTLISMEGWGYGATGYSVAPRVMVRGYAGETWSDTTQASYLAFWTTPTTTIVPQERMRINADGSITGISSLGITGTRVTTGFFTDLAVTNTITGTTSGNLVSGGALGTPSSGTLTNCSGLPISGLTSSTATALGVGSIELGDASDTTIARVSAGVISVEGVTIPSISSTSTLTNKRINPRLVSAASYTTDTGTSLDISTCDQFIITAQAGALKFNNPGGTPVNGNKLIIRIKDNGSPRALTYDTQFRALGTALPTTTVTSKTLYMGFIYNSDDTKWDLVAAAQEA